MLRGEGGFIAQDRGKKTKHNNFFGFGVGFFPITKPQGWLLRLGAARSNAKKPDPSWSCGRAPLCRRVIYEPA